MAARKLLATAAVLAVCGLQGCETSPATTTPTTPTTTTTTTTSTPSPSKARIASEVVTVPGWPDLKGKFPLSFAIKAGGLVYANGMQGMDMKTMKLVDGGIKEETTMIMSNLKVLLEAANSSMDQVTLCSVSLVNITRDFQDFNEAYAAAWPKGLPSAPARVVVQVGLAGNASVEIQCNAALNDRLRETVTVPGFPASTGQTALNWATKVDGMVYTSGLIGMNMTSGQMAKGIKAETTQALKNLATVLEASASDAGSVVGCSVSLTNMSDFAEMNEAYQAFWPSAPALGGLPTRVCVEVVALRGSANVEIQCTAAGADMHGDAPKAVKVPGWPEMKGFPFSAVATADGMAYISGNQGIDMHTSKRVEGGAGPETTQTLKDIKEAAEAAGTGLNEVVACEVSLTDMKNFAEMNKAYASFWPSEPPSRIAVQVGALARDAAVEIRCLAALPSSRHTLRQAELEVLV